jgi:transcriptional regulator with XRE-family HTH domain
MIDEERLAHIIYSARKRKGITQAEIARTTGITQGTLSKIESAVCSVSAKHWFLLSDLLEIPTSSVWSGYIDRGIKPRFETVKNSFKLPKTYYENAFSTVKEITPFLIYIERAFGKEKLEAYFKEKKLNKYFFVDLNNKINFLFASDLLLGFYSPEEINVSLFEKIAAIAQEPVYHGVHKEVYEKKNTAMSRLKALIENIAFYQTAYRFKVISKTATEIRFQISRFRISDHNSATELLKIEQFQTPFREKYIEAFCTTDNQSSLKITLEKKEDDGTLHYKASI